MPNYQSPVRTKSLVGLPAGSFTQEEVLSPLMLNGPSLAGKNSFVASGAGSGSPLIRRPSLTAAELEAQRQLQSQGQSQPGSSTPTPPAAVPAVAPSPTKAKAKTSPQIPTKVSPSKVKVNGDSRKAAGDKRSKQEKAILFDLMRTAKPIFRRWREMAAGHLEWAKAVERSDVYSRKVRNQRSRREMKHTNGKKRRESFEDEEEEGAQSERSSRHSWEERRKIKRRTLTRATNPRTDEQLAVRLREVGVVLNLVFAWNWSLMAGPILRTMNSTSDGGRRVPSLMLPEAISPLLLKAIRSTTEYGCLRILTATRRLSGWIASSTFRSLGSGSWTIFSRYLSKKEIWIRPRQD